MSDLPSFLSPLLSGAAGAVGVAVLAKLSLRAEPDRSGWRHIRPSAMHWLGLIGSAGMAGLILYIRLFVGSARADAETQMMWASVLIAVFAVGTLVSFWQIVWISRAGVHWRGTRLRFTGPKGEEKTLSMTDALAMRRRWTGTIEIAFPDGIIVKLDENAQGVVEFWDRMVEVNDHRGK